VVVVGGGAGGGGAGGGTGVDDVGAGLEVPLVVVVVACGV